MTLIMVMYIASGILLSALSIPLILRKIKPNGLYGFRVKQTLEDPTLWYAVNTYAGKRLFVAGICTSFTAAILYLVPGLSLDAYALACLAVTFIVLVIGITQSVLFMKKQEHIK
ncbi:MAG: SdpI family protein [Anaerolineaceae bacterium]|nr:SdpI family protein [Anaerolineaceae bacterium]